GVRRQSESGDAALDRRAAPTLVQIQGAVAAFALPAHSKMSASDLWRFLLIGYPFTILIETPILLLGLSSRHSLKRRLFAGVWLTACTYPIVVLVMPLMFANASRGIYLAVAETFAPVAECVLFWLA